MNILSVSGRFGDDAGGWRVQNILKQLRAHGQHVRLVENQTLSTQNWISKALRLARSEATTLRELQESSYDLVYGNGTATFYCLPGKLRRVPLVFDMHGLSVEEYLLQNVTRGNFAKVHPAYIGRIAMDWSCLHFSDTIVCVSKSQMRHLNRSRQVPQEKMVYATNGVDVSYFRPQSGQAVDSLRMNLGFEGKMVFGYVGSTGKRSNNWQGVQQFIATANAIRDTEVAFLVVGAEETYRKGNLVMVQRQPRDRLNEYYAACDVLVLPIPKHESMSIASPTKFAEYAAVGRPILSTDVGDPPEFIRKNDCGIVIPDFATDTMVEGIMNFKGTSSGRLNLMGARSRILAEQNFDWDKIGASLSNALRKYER